MAVTYEPIASTTLGSDTASVEFTSISGTFTDLILVITGTATSEADAVLQFNSDTGSNYSFTRLYGTGSSAGSARSSNQSFIKMTAYGWFGTSTGNVIVCHIMSYANTNVYKTALAAAARSDSGVDRVVGLWRSTNAITSLLVKPESGSLKTGTTVNLYGVKAA